MKPFTTDCNLHTLTGNNELTGRERRHGDSSDGEVISPRRTGTFVLKLSNTMVVTLQPEAMASDPFPSFLHENCL